MDTGTEIKPATDGDVDRMEAFARREPFWKPARWRNGYMTLILRIRQLQAQHKELLVCGACGHRAYQEDSDDR